MQTSGTLGAPSERGLCEGCNRAVSSEVDACPYCHQARPYSSSKSYLLKLYSDGKKIDAIRGLRELTGLGLVDAKRIAESWDPVYDGAPLPPLPKVKKSRDVGSMKRAAKDALWGYSATDFYEKIVLFGLGVPGFLLLFAAKDYEIVPSYGMKTAYISWGVAVLLLVVMGIVYIYREHDLPFEGDFWRAFLLSLFTIPFFAIMGIAWVNCYFDHSKPENRTITVLDLSESHRRRRRGYSINSYRVSVSSWRKEMESIDISLKADEYRNMQYAKGATLTLRTMDGVLGLEHIAKDEKGRVFY